MRGLVDFSQPKENMPVFSLGSRGSEVVELQRALTAAGHPCDADGRFGPKTLAAVKAFQVARGLAPDGIVGPRTMAALEALAPTDRPPPTEIWGVDVSEMNPKVPYAALAREGCAFVVVRCMTGSDRDGVMRRDKMYDTHQMRFADVGVPTIGAYGWTSEGKDGAEQADTALTVTRDLKGFLSLDYEPAKGGAFKDPKRATEVGCDFAATVLDVRKTCPIYASPNTLLNAPLPGLEAQPLWLAHYGPKTWPAAPPPWRAVTLWQREVAVIAGVKIDKNVYRGTLEELRRAMGGA